MSERNRKENRPSFRKKPVQGQTGRQALESKFYDNADMMHLFKVSSRTLQRWRDERIIAYKKIGGKIFYLAEKVEELMQSDDYDEDNEAER